MTSTSVIPQLRNFAACEACGDKVAIVTVKPDGRRRTIDVEPKPLAEYALLRDGVTVINLRHPRVDLDLADRHEGPKFWDHAKTCRVPGMVTMRTILEAEGGYQPDAERERKRKRLRDAGRSPWVKREPGK